MSLMEILPGNRPQLTHLEVEFFFHDSERRQRLSISPDDALLWLLTLDDYLEIPEKNQTYPITPAAFYQSVSYLHRGQRQTAYGFDPLDFEKGLICNYITTSKNEALGRYFSIYCQSNYKALLEILEIASYTRNLFALNLLLILHPAIFQENSIIPINLLDYIFLNINDIYRIYSSNFRKESWHICGDKFCKIMTMQTICCTPQFLEFILYDVGVSLEKLKQSYFYKVLFSKIIARPIAYETITLQLQHIVNSFIASSCPLRGDLTSPKDIAAWRFRNCDN